MQKKLHSEKQTKQKNEQNVARERRAALWEASLCVDAAHINR